MTKILRQIIPLGCGFTTEPGKPSFVPYIFSACGTSNPRILFLPTASADSEGSIAGFYEMMARVECRPSYLSLFRQPLDMAERIASADIIYVGGGNTRNLIALWKAAGLDILLREAWERGTVLCGQSAGGICWFDDAQTTSTGEPGPVKCLGFLSGSCSTHYDSNAARRPHLQKSVAEGTISPGYALDDNAGLHFHGTELHATLVLEPHRKVFRVTRNPDGTATETEIPATLIGSSTKT
jgi:peptidase E